jgi:hypothetical protein
MAISSLKTAKDGRLNYIQGLGVGTVTAIVASVIFGIFSVINVLYFGSDIINVLRSENIFGEHLTVSAIFWVITMIGIPGGMITSFIAMQWFKRPDHTMTK